MSACCAAGAWDSDSRRKLGSETFPGPEPVCRGSTPGLPTRTGSEAPSSRPGVLSLGLWTRRAVGWMPNGRISDRLVTQPSRGFSPKLSEPGRVLIAPGRITEPQSLPRRHGPCSETWKAAAFCSGGTLWVQLAPAYSKQGCSP